MSVSSLYAELRHQQSLLAANWQTLKEANDERQQYERRLAELEDIESTICSGLNSPVDAVNDHERLTRSKVGDALLGSAEADTLLGTLQNADESSLPYDGHGSGLLAYVRWEMEDCRDHIRYLQSQAALANRNIRTVNANIANINAAIARSRQA